MLVTGGNHDHGLIAGWIDARLQSEPSGFLGLSEPVEPEQAGPLAMRIGELVAPGAAAARLPGRLAARRRLRHPRPLPRPALDDADVRAARRRRDGALGRPPARARRPARRLRGRARAALRVPAPAHAALRPRGGQRRGGRVGARLGRARGGGARAATPSAPQRSARATSARSPLLNALGLGPVDRDLSGSALRRGGLHGMREVLRRLGVTAPHVLFGHTHRSGPWPQDDPAEWAHAGGLAAGQHRLVGLPAALPLRRAERLAVLARHGGRDRRRRPAAAHPPAGRPRPRGARARARALSRATPRPRA